MKWKWDTTSSAVSLLSSRSMCNDYFVYFLWRLEHFKQSFTNLPLVLWHINWSISCKWTGLLTVDGRQGCFRDWGKKHFFVCCVVFVKLFSDGSAFTDDILHIQCERPRWRLNTRGCRRVWEKFPEEFEELDLFLQRVECKGFAWTETDICLDLVSSASETHSTSSLEERETRLHSSCLVPRPLSCHPANTVRRHWCSLPVTQRIHSALIKWARCYWSVPFSLESVVVAYQATMKTTHCFHFLLRLWWNPLKSIVNSHVICTWCSFLWLSAAL